PRGAARPLQTGGWPPPRGGARRWRRGGGNRRRPARRSAPVCVPRGRPSLGERPRRADGGRRVRPPQQRRGGHRRGRGGARAVRLLAALGVTVLGVTAVAAQQPLAARLAGRVPAGVVVAVTALADSAAARGLPVDPLVEKAIEGGAKGASPERIVVAVQTVLTRLGRAQVALQAATPGVPPADAVEGGPFRLPAGLQDANVQGGAAAGGP